MVHYRRSFTPGGTYFFTVTLRDRQSDWLIEYVDLLRQAMRQTQLVSPYKIEAIVILPDHLHAIWTLPEDDADYPGRWRKIKSEFTHQLVKIGLPLRKNNRTNIRCGNVDFGNIPFGMKMILHRMSIIFIIIR